MISRQTIASLEAREHEGVHYILGARMRRVKESRDEVLLRTGRDRVVHESRQQSKDPSPLKVKEVWVEDRRYGLCFNQEQAEKDRRDRKVIVASLRDRLKRDLDALVEISTQVHGKTIKLRSRIRGDAGKALQAVGVALGRTAQPQA
jgi:hypothetical protein